MWDVESKSDKYTGDNFFKYSFSMFCRKKGDTAPLCQHCGVGKYSKGVFCGKCHGDCKDCKGPLSTDCTACNAGSYVSVRGTCKSYECNKDFYSGGWIKVGSYHDAKTR